MEKEMKQIMDLFAKERKSRKKEMAKLKEQLDEKESVFQEERSSHIKEKNELVIKWQQDSEKH